MARGNAAKSGLLSRSGLFRSKIRLALPAIQGRFAEISGNREFIHIYPRYLISMHYIIRASVPLMEFALNKAALLPGSDPVKEEFCRYLTKHINEERYHDEWLLDDIESLGIPRSSVLEEIPDSACASLAGSQYYWIAHHHPVSILGYIGVLEGSPPSIPFIEKMIRTSALPGDSFRTLIKHAKLDPIHKNDLDDLLDRLELTPAQESFIGVSAFHTIRLISEIFEEILGEPD